MSTHIFIATKNKISGQVLDVPKNPRGQVIVLDVLDVWERAQKQSTIRGQQDNEKREREKAADGLTRDICYN